MSKSSIWRAIKAGRLSASRIDDGGFAIDPAELFRAFLRNGSSNVPRDRAQQPQRRRWNGLQRPNRAERTTWQ
jgi:hypothetical protein